MIDTIITEPLGGIHRNPELAKSLLKDALKKQLQEVTAMNIDDLVQQRAEKLLSFGKFRD